MDDLKAAKLKVFKLIYYYIIFQLMKILNKTQAKSLIFLI